MWGLKRLSVELTSWCETQEMPHDRRIRELTLKMIGGATDVIPHPGNLMKVKAAEVGVLLEFGVHGLVELHPGKNPYGDDLVGGGKCLARYLEVIREAGTILSREQREELMDNYIKHCIHCQTALVHFVPKHHLIIHLTFWTF